MKILFSVGSFGFLRNFEPALRLLAERGHDLHLVADRKDSVGGTRTLELLERDHPSRIRHSYMGRHESPWHPLATQLRLSQDCWRYLDPRYDQSPSLRARGASQAPWLAAALTRSAAMRSPGALAAMRRVTRRLERALPPGDRIERFLKSEAPDLLLLTPLLYFGSPQAEYVRAARRLGVRTALGVGSWDHLTTKGLIHETPDRLLVWNEAQRVEAWELHGVPAERVTVTGAQSYDHWFVQRPGTSRDAFCAQVGLPTDRPILLYLCSSPFITPHEVPFVRRWIEAVRSASDAEVARAAILIRPHPQNALQWTAFDDKEYGAVAVWPRQGANPVDRDARAEYFDSMFHSAAVVGVNTSALIESGIVGRRVYTILTDDFAGQQEGTLHFQHLKNVNGGLLHVAATLGEHVEQLSGPIRHAAAGDRSRAFVQAFVRPYGLDVAAAPRFVEALEQQVREPAPAPVRERAADLLVRSALWPFAAVARAAARAKKGRRRDDGAPRPLRVMFAYLSPEFLRFYDSTMTELADRGYEVSVGVTRLRERKEARLEGLADERVRVLGLIPKRTDVWTPLARAVRGTFDFVRYFHPRLAAAASLRARMKRKVLPPWLSALDRIESLDERALTRLLGFLAGLESAIPISRRLRRFLDAHRPDLVVVSPLVDAASDQVDLVRATQARGIPVAAAIASWDNLTNKGHLRVQPDLVTVWNQQQKREAVEYHAVDPARVAVTGAQLFDRWFERRPSQSREDFCAMVGLPADRPIILYTGSSVFIARSELEEPFARRWIAALRASDDPVLREASILIRPHPYNTAAWEAADYREFGPVEVYPRQRYTPSAESARSSFFDSLYHSTAVVGVNTSAMIEATILGRPVFAMLTPDFAGTQEGTVHFHYLLPENGGFLRVARSVGEHTAQLSDVLRHPEVARAQSEQFVATFLRPRGVERPCTPILADALEQAARAGRAEARETAGVRLLRVAVWPFAVALKIASLGDQAGSALGRGAFEAYRGASRGRRILLKAVTPSRAGVRAWWEDVRARVARLPKQALRAARHVRYHAAVWIRGEAQER
jgi:hypothetical protein